MKPSNLVTPRTLNECHWTPGYTSLPSGKNETIGEIIAGYVLAVVIGVGIAVLLIAWWRS
jgi:ABC-type nitrate/sulfonate/bicarbonate transport system permease component